MRDAAGAPLLQLVPSEAPRPTTGGRELFDLLWRVQTNHYWAGTQQELVDLCMDIDSVRTIARRVENLEQLGVVTVGAEKGVRGLVYKLLRRTWPVSDSDTATGQPLSGPALASVLSSSSSRHPDTEPDTLTRHPDTTPDTTELTSDYETYPAEVWGYLQVQATTAVLDAIGARPIEIRLATYQRYLDHGGYAPGYIPKCLATVLENAAMAEVIEPKSVPRPSASPARPTAPESPYAPVWRSAALAGVRALDRALRRLRMRLEGDQ